MKASYERGLERFQDPFQSPVSGRRRHGEGPVGPTQMLESMTENPRPTGAEASDVANAIFDRTDAVMLSGELPVVSIPAKRLK